MAGGYFPHSRQQASEQSSEYSFSHLVPVRHWVRDPSLRSWPVLLLIGLVCVPPIALVLLNNATEATIHDVAWIFAVYFAVAWMLLLGVIVRPQHVHRSMLAAIAVIGIVTQAPIAIFLETKLHSSTGSLLDIFTIGVPEELAKAIPIVVVAWIWRKNWQTQTPRDYLFLGAVSGLVFGAAEVVHYFTDVLGSLSGNVNGLVLQGLTIQYIWRFLTDPIDHACWAGITGYFIGLAITGQTRKYAIAGIGIGIAAVLHGLNDWNPINAHPAWVLITLISVLLFLGYARAGAVLPHERFALGEAQGQQPVPGQLPALGQVAASGHMPPEPWPGPATAGAHGSAAPREPWWQSSPGSPRPASAGQAPAGYAPSGQPVYPGQPVPAGQPAHAGQPPHAGQAAHAGQPGQQPQTVVTQVLPRQPKPPPKPWWEQ
jgi:RsiW-degrading membrane proteinase PrsW (M82 family)